MDSIRYLLLLHIRNSFLKIAVERYLPPPAGGLLLLLMQSMMTLDNFQAGFHRSFRVQGCALCVPLFSLRDSSSSRYLRIDDSLVEQPLCSSECLFKLSASVLNCVAYCVVQNPCHTIISIEQYQPLPIRYTRAFPSMYRRLVLEYNFCPLQNGALSASTFCSLDPLGGMTLGCPPSKLFSCV